MSVSDEEILAFIENATKTMLRAQRLKIFIPPDLEFRFRILHGFVPYYPTGDNGRSRDIGELDGRPVQVNSLVPPERIYVLDPMSLVIGENPCQIHRG